MIRTRLTELLGIRHPIVQAAMGYVSGPRLAAATSDAGGLGLIASATMSLAELEVAIADTAGRTRAPFGVNLRADAPDAAERVKLIIARRVPVASFAQAPKPELIATLKEAGVVTIASVGARRHAEKAAGWGIDAVIATGSEGGGHVGAVPTSLLIPQVAAAVDVPVIAAGGFFDGRGLVAALAWGAAGIAMGTRFLLTSDSPVPDAVKQVYLAAGLDGTVVTTRVDGVPHRVLRTRMVDHLNGGGGGAGGGGAAGRVVRSVRSAAAYRGLAGVGWREMVRQGRAMRREGGLSWGQVMMAANTPVLLRAAMVDGRTDLGLMSSGQVAGLIEDLPSCGELIAAIMRDAETCLDRMATLRSASKEFLVRTVRGVSRQYGSQALDDGDVGLAAAFAHGQEAVAAAGALEGVDQGGEQAGAGGAEGVAEGDRAAAHVDLTEVGAGLALPGQDHRGERLVDLDQVDPGQGHPGLVQGVRGGRDGRGQHQDRVVAAGGQVDDPGPGAQAVLADGAAGRDEQGGGAVGDLAGQGGGDPAACAQRLEGGHLVQGGVAAGALVLGHVLIRDDLGAERAVVDRADGSLVAGQGVALHLGAADPPLVRDQVRGAELGDLLGAVPLAPALAVGEGAFGAHGGTDGDLAHVLHAARHDQAGGAAEHGLGGEVHRLLGRAALPVDGDAGYRLGQARGQPRGAGDVAGLGADRVHAAEYDVVDGGRVDLGAGQQFFYDVRAEIGRVRRG
jgi:NAD(P)H-dependent flavin oxidoreductase YrpB (nitropropane dioxygenase family)